MRQAVVSKGRQQISEFQSYPSPVGGWNSVDALSNMQPSEALVLDNWYPRPGFCEIRGGSISHATSMASNGKTLAVYNALSDTNKMFCATSTAVYDVSSSGAAVSVASRTNGKHQHLQFGDGTNNYLIMVNGVDKALYYDGTTWILVDGASSPALTGIATTELIGLCESKGRLFFIAKNSLKFWYLAAGAAGGALTAFDLSGVAQNGGFLMAIVNWTVDAGNGPDDRVVFITSKGELIIYQGTNPGVAATWSLVGVYSISPPIGRNCTIKIGPDLAILTRSGVFPLSTLLTSTGLDFSKAVTYKIQQSFNEAALNYGSVFGWKAISFPEQSAVLVNIPTEEDGIHYQYVLNTISNAWCRFIGWDAEDFAVFNNELYFCDGTTVVKAWVGRSDLGNNIVAYARTAFSYFGQKGRLKEFKMFKPVLGVDGVMNYLIGIDIDFNDSGIFGSSINIAPTLAKWGSAIWNVDKWAYALQIISNWSSASAYPGFAAAGKIKVETKSLNVKWFSSDYMYELGNGL